MLAIDDLATDISSRKNTFIPDGPLLNLRSSALCHLIIITITAEEGELKPSPSNYMYKGKSAYLLKCITHFNFT